MEQFTIHKAQYKPITVQTMHEEPPTTLEKVSNDPNSIILIGILVAVVVVGFLLFKKKS